jgi:hypothetical protein
MNENLLWVRVRADGEETQLKVHVCKLQQVMDAANKRYGDPEKILGGPEPVKKLLGHAEHVVPRLTRGKK